MPAERAGRGDDPGGDLGADRPLASSTPASASVAVDRTPTTLSARRLGPAGARRYLSGERPVRTGRPLSRRILWGSPGERGDHGHGKDGTGVFQMLEIRVQIVARANSPKISPRKKGRARA